MRSADQVGFQLRQTALGVVGMQGNQQLADDEAEDGVAQKLKLFVIVEDALEILLVDQRFMGQRAFQQLAALEGVAQGPFESLQFRAHRSEEHTSELQSP